LQREAKKASNASADSMLAEAARLVAAAKLHA
jgi:hypothetical protein